MNTNSSKRHGQLAALFCGLSAAITPGHATEPESQDEITIRADRPASKVVGRTSSGLPVRLYELTYRVGYADLDLTAGEGADALRKRVEEAAKSACKDLDKLYPEIEPDRSCARKTAERSMAQVTQIIERAKSRKEAASR